MKRLISFNGQAALIATLGVLIGCAADGDTVGAVEDSATALPVFPGAVGYGTKTIAGRGGNVIEVTNLRDSGPGSLRAALDEPEPRTIVFRTGGTIRLKGELQIIHPYVTIAGQTAPGDGILLRHAGITVMTHDVLMQHLRIRPGVGGVDPENNDCISLLGPQDGLVGASNVVIDHVSMSWSQDEAFSMFYAPHDITVSNSIISEALDKSGHPKVHHSAGVLLGTGGTRMSFHHNLAAHNDFRNPLIIGGGRHEVVNNFFYDWGVLGGEIVAEGFDPRVNMIANTFKPGPSSNPDEDFFEITIFDPEGGNPKLYVAENRSFLPPKGKDNWSLVGLDGAFEAPRRFRRGKPVNTPMSNRYDSAQDASDTIIATAGASKPRRDPVDTRVVDETVRGTGSIINRPRQVGGYPTMARGKAPADNDHDGMPNRWERRAGLNPNNAADRNDDPDDDGYTNLEEYLHSLL